MTRKDFSRREFVDVSAKAAFGAMIVPSHVLGGRHQAPSDTLNIAIVGAGGMGGNNAAQFNSENIVAVCDVDFAQVERKLEGDMTDGDGNVRPKVARWKEQYDAAAKFQDFREMLATKKGDEA